jgi:hypothetical protein
MFHILLFAAAMNAGTVQVPAPDSLNDLTTRQVRARLGEPAVAHAEGKGAMWTYRSDDCALMVFFEDKGKGLRTAGAVTGPRKRGEPVPALDDCVAGLKPLAVGRR